MSRFFFYLLLSVVLGVPMMERPKQRCGGMDPVAELSWQHWSGTTLDNDRNAVNENIINAENARNLSIKWVFEVTKIRKSYNDNATIMHPTGGVSMTPTIADGVVYGMENGGTLFAVDEQTGIPLWERTLLEITGVDYYSRSSPLIVGDWLIVATAPTNPYSNTGSHAFAIERRNGTLVWDTLLESNSWSEITSSPVAYGDRIFIGISSGESAFITSCCSFKGSVVALDVCSGEILWRFYTIPPSYGEDFYGASVWGSAFPIDPARNAVYVTTGNNYAVSQGVSDCERSRGVGDPSCFPDDVWPDSVLALDMTTGELLWGFRSIAYEAWTAACESSSNLNLCPYPRGPDFDINQSPVAFTLADGTDVLGVGSKSGGFWVIRRDDGKLIWKDLTGVGSTSGGSGWGVAYDKKLGLLFTVNQNGMRKSTPLPCGTSSAGYWIALTAEEGQTAWCRFDPNYTTSSSSRPVGPITVANGVMFAGTLDPIGHMYAFNALNGEILWEFESGGSVNSSPSIHDGVLFWGSGYSYRGGTFNNKLYAFHVGAVPM